MGIDSMVQITKSKGQIIIKYDKLEEIDPIEEIDFVQHLIKLKEKISTDNDIAKQFGELLINEIELRLSRILIWYIEQLDNPSEG
jgi:hypothetical protein